LMALFRDVQLAPFVSQDALIVLIRETGQCLLDSRLAVVATHVSGLDESTSSQMVRGMNKVRCVCVYSRFVHDLAHNSTLKLAVQAATGSARHTALQALMILQEQMTLRGAESPVESAFKGRLSRIVMKLFGKVIKTEELSISPYSSPSVNLEALLCTIDDLLSAVHAKEAPGQHEGSDMATSLITSILKFRRTTEVTDLIQKLGMGDSEDGIWSMVMNLDPSPSTRGPKYVAPASPASKASTTTSAHSKDVAQLVSAIGSAPEGPERLAAVEVLRGYRDRHGDEDLNSHLEKVSDNFRDYIWEQFSLSVATPAKTISNDTDSLPMSARIRNLRSKLSMSDVATDGEIAAPSPPRAGSTAKSPAAPSRIPTPSRIPRAATPTAAPSTTVLSLRQRLAAAQANRSKATEFTEETDAAQPAPSSHAAALRARLQAVKHQTQESD
jgi:hypothetical protein